MLFLIFKAGENEYALETDRIVRIAPCTRLRPCCDAPAYIAGILNFRSEPVVVVDASMLINHTSCARLLSTRIIIARCLRPGKGQTLLGLMAENVSTFIKQDRSDFIENVLKTSGNNYLGPMFKKADRLVQIVKIEEILPVELENILAATA